MALTEMRVHMRWINIGASIAAVLVFGASGKSLAQTGWTNGNHMGVSTASVVARDGSMFEIYCNECQEDKLLGISLSVGARKQLVGKHIVEVIVNETRFVFQFNDGVSNEVDYQLTADVTKIESLLSTEKAKYFTVLVPDVRWQANFQTAGARSALERSKKGDFITESCVKP